MMENENNSLELYTFEDDFDCAAECIDLNGTIPEEETAMTERAIGYLLDEVLKKKSELLDPRHRRNRFFSDIRDRLRVKGFIFQQETLQKKFHNLKKHFVILCQNRDNGSIKKPVAWPYFDKMMQIFAEELDIEDAPTMASLYPDLPLPKNAIELKRVKKKSETLHDTRNDSDEDLDVVEEFNDEGRESQWSHKAVLQFLDECIKVKEDFYNPNIRRRNIFNKIRQKLKHKGFNFFQESLDRKLRNMKTHYQIVMRADPKVRKQRRAGWPYFEQLHEIYGDENNRHLIMKKLELKSAVSSKKTVKQKMKKTSPIKEEPKTNTPNVTPPLFVSLPSSEIEQLETAEQYIEEFPPVDAASNDSNTGQRQPSSPGDFDRRSSQGAESLVSHSLEEYLGQSKTSLEETLLTDAKPVEESEMDSNFYTRILALEERRAIVAESIAEEIKKSNKLRQERLDFKRYKLECMIARAKRKNQLNN